MLDHPALDVAIGLIFLYIILALVCTTINESIMTWLGMRARFLELGLRNLLSATPMPTAAGGLTLKRFFEHPLTQTMVRPKRGRSGDVDPTEPTKMFKKPPYPSYLPSRTFVSVLVDLTRETKEWHEKAGPEEVAKAEARIKKAKEGFEESLASIPNAPLSEALLAVYRSVDKDATRFHAAAERWYDDTMERVSGWYKRRVQLFLLVIATAVVVPLNADTLSTSRVLWRDEAVRAAVVKKAEAAAAGTLEETEVESAVKQLDVPLGWELSPGDGPAEIPNDPLAIIAKIFGLLLTVLAVLLGAPFWFDLLSKVMRVRSTGAPPPATDAKRSGEGEQPRSGSKSD
jgi:hypothetical protein